MSNPFSQVTTQQQIARQHAEFPTIRNKDIAFYQDFLKKYAIKFIMVYNEELPCFQEIRQDSYENLGSSIPLTVKNFQGNWDASTNNPVIPPATLLNTDFYYFVSVAGVTNIDGTNSWNVGDYIQSIGTKWVKVGSSSETTYKTRIVITADKAANSPILTNASGAGFTKSLENTYLGTNNGLFNSNNKVRILLNGVELSKSDGVSFVTSVSFAINKPLAIDEVIEIYSNETI